MNNIGIDALNKHFASIAQHEQAIVFSGSEVSALLSVILACYTLVINSSCESLSVIKLR